MKINSHLLAIILFLILLNLISYLVIFFVSFNALLYPYHDIADPRISNVISGETLLFYVVLTVLGIILSTLASFVSLFVFLRKHRLNTLMRFIRFGFIIISVGAMIYCSYRLIELWSINMSLGGDCIFEQHCQSIERSLMFV